MKICFLIPSLVGGGAERILSYIANFWTKKGYQITIISFDHPKQEPFYELEPSIRLVRLNLGPETRFFQKITTSWQQITEVRRQLKIQKPEVVVAFLDTAIFVALIATRFLPVKVVVSERNNPYRNSTNPLRQRINNQLYFLADRIILQTRQIADTFPDSLQSKIQVIPNPVLPPSVQIKDYEEQQAFKTMVAIGRLAHQKGFDLLIHAFASLASKYSDWRLHIVGTGKELPTLQQLCVDLSVKERVVFLGQVKDIDSILYNSSFFVLSSRFEGFPNALCEAMAVGLPVIATRCPFGPEEIIQQEYDGILVPTEDSQQLSNAMHTLITDQTKYTILGTHAKEVVQRFSIDRVMQQWEAVIRSL